MSQKLNRQSRTLASHASEKGSQVIREHQAALDAWYEQWMSAHRRYVHQLVAATRSAESNSDRQGG